jgi:hypothetical protein
MNEPVKEISVSENVVIKIYYDEDPLNPREDFDNLGVIYSNHQRYNPDGHSIEELGDSWDEIMSNLKENYVWAKVYAYIHSGIALSLSSFNDPWDSGLFGIIAAKKEDVRKEYGKKRISKQVRDKVIGVFKGEVEELSAYYNGEVYGYVIEKDGEEMESCWGYFDLDYAEDSAKEAADGYAA